MSEIEEKSLHVFLSELASNSATPGGGSVAALMGAQSAALTSMVCNLTIGKQKYAEVELEMQNLLVKSEKLRSDLAAMIQADIDVFNKMMEAYGLAKDTDQEKMLRTQQIQLVLKAATEIPLDCAKACSEAIAISQEAADKGNVNVVSDAGVAVMSAYAGLKSAALNVYTNTASLKDRDFAEKKLAELEEILGKADIKSVEIYQLVKNKL